MSWGQNSAAQPSYGTTAERDPEQGWALVPSDGRVSSLARYPCRVLSVAAETFSFLPQHDLHDPISFRMDEMILGIAARLIHFFH